MAFRVSRLEDIKRLQRAPKELRGFVTPIREQANRSYDEVRSISALKSQLSEVGEHLERLTEAHVVG